MSDRDVQKAMKRLCTAAMQGGIYHAEVCQWCESPCRYGEQALKSLGLCRMVEKETPTERVSVMGSKRVRAQVLGYNKRSIIR